MIRQLIDAICTRLIMGPANGQPHFQIDKLQLKSGDRILVKVNERITSEMAAKVRDQMNPLLPTGVRCIVIDKSCDLAVLTAEQIRRAEAA